MRWLVVMTVVALILAGLLVGSSSAIAQSAPPDTGGTALCFGQVPVIETTWGGIKALYSSPDALRPSRPARQFAPRASDDEILGVYVAWSDEHKQRGEIGAGHAQIAARVYAEAADEHPLYALMCGDMVEQPNLFDFDSLRVMLITAGLWDRVRPVPGNHEDFFHDGFMNYLSWSAGKTVGHSQYGLAYAFDDTVAGVRFIAGCYDYVVDRAGRESYRAWVEDQCKTMPIGYIPVYYQHNPPFSQIKRGGEQVPAQTLLADIFDLYRVIVLAGHSHGFEVYQFQQPGALYYTIGGAGMELSEIDSHEYDGALVAKTALRHHFLTMEASVKGMHIRVVTVESPAGPGGIVLDDRFIERDPCLDRSKL